MGPLTRKLLGCRGAVRARGGRLHRPAKLPLVPPQGDYLRIQEWMESWLTLHWGRGGRG